MNRKERRRAMPDKAKPFGRAALIASAVNLLANTTDQTISGVTLITSDGEMIYIPAAPLQSNGNVQ